MNTLAIDTSEKRGSIAVRRDGKFVLSTTHVDVDYSTWLIPAAEAALNESRMKFQELDLLAVSTGPGSFTGVRVGLCTVKAWAEVYGKPIVGVSRLEAMASHAALDGWVAVSYDAHRGQIFGGLYQRSGGHLIVPGAEMVLAPAEFLAYVTERSTGVPAQFLSLDSALIANLPGWAALARTGSTLQEISSELADAIGRIAEERAAKGEFTDVLQLDANYVRRSDAEIFWKGPGYRVV